jgi:hypothetical protein
MDPMILIAGVFAAGDAVLIYHLLRERRQHTKTRNALKFWQRHSRMMPTEAVDALRRRT